MPHFALKPSSSQSLGRLLKSIAVLLAMQPGTAAFANIIGTPTQNFNPVTSGIDFVTVHSSETLRPGYFNFGFFLNYAVNSLPYYQSTSQSVVSFGDTLLSSDFNVGYGLFRNWEVGLSVPFTIAQTVSDTTGAHGQFASYGNSEVRPSTKFRFLGDETRGLALVASMNFNRIINEPYTGSNPGPTLNLEIAGTTLWNGIVVGANLGHRWRNPGQPIVGAPVQPLGNMLIASVAGSYLLEKIDTKLIVELFGGVATQDTGADPSRSHNSLEMLAGVKHDLTHNIAGHAGLGTKIVHGVAAPDWRVYTGVNWSFGPVFRSSDNDQYSDKDSERFVFRNILFEFNSDKMTGDFQTALDELVAFMNKPPGFQEVVVEGHTDSRGSSDYNLKLSDRRAKAIKRYLVEHYKIPENKVTAIGYGATRPIANNGNYQGRQTNRRVEFKVVRPK